MFHPEAEMEIDRLRQGDILEEIPFPLLDLKQVNVLGEIQPGGSVKPFPSITTKLHPHREDPHYFWGQVPMRLSHCAVLSNCCEIEPRHGKILQAAFSVARLIPIKNSIQIDMSKLESLRANRDPLGNPPGFLDYFYIEPHLRLGGRDWMVDFSQIVSIPNSEFPRILERKVLQMLPQHRIRLKVKVAAYFGRLASDESVDMAW
jgi:hypothetical protein